MINAIDQFNYASDNLKTAAKAYHAAEKEMLKKEKDPTHIVQEVPIHNTEQGNPHGTTKEDIGLGNVANYSLATVDEAKSNRSDKYMTPHLTNISVNEKLNNIKERMFTEVPVSPVNGEYNIDPTVGTVFTLNVGSSSSVTYTTLPTGKVTEVVLIITKTNTDALVLNDTNGTTITETGKHVVKLIVGAVNKPVIVK